MSAARLRRQRQCGIDELGKLVIVDDIGILVDDVHAIATNDG
jgi:hypothetical protein